MLGVLRARWALERGGKIGSGGELVWGRGTGLPWGSGPWGLNCLSPGAGEGDTHNLQLTWGTWKPPQMTCWGS